MADADEDRPLQSSSSLSSSGFLHQDQVDLSEETQDYRFLSSFSNSLSSIHGGAGDNDGDDDEDDDHARTLPKRGEKDFEPNPTQSQASTLSASRQAMHNALSFPRLHQPKTHIIAQYCPDFPRGEACVRVDVSRGQHFRTLGTSDSSNRVWLLPEEALYMLERGTLDIRWPEEKGRGGVVEREDVEDDGDEKQEEEELAEARRSGETVIGELPMSLQGAYASFIGRSGLTLERYVVFAGLRRTGYTVMRAPTWSEGHARLNGHVGSQPPPPPAETGPHDDDVAVGHSRNSHPQMNPTWGGGLFWLFSRLLSYIRGESNRAASPSLGPLVAPGLYRSYNDIYRALALIPFHDPAPPTDPIITTTTTTDPPTPPPPLHAPFCISYHVWKPSSPYRKSSPPEPDFRLAVLDATACIIPTMAQIGALLDNMPTDEQPKERRLEQKLKHGKRSVILAVVDTGVVSYLRFSEAGFGQEKLYEAKTEKKSFAKTGGGPQQRGDRKGGRGGGRGGRGSRGGRGGRGKSTG